jgi:hypothetical protein
MNDTSLPAGKLAGEFLQKSILLSPTNLSIILYCVGRDLSWK